jgi:uncharacterized protein (TIGR02996 family)
MSTESALLAAILAHPDEDTPRLAYADWLDENADALPGRDPQEVRARAEFIRLQIACEGHDGDPDFDAARDRASTLRLRYWKLWQPPFPSAEGWWGFESRRGFAECAHRVLARFPALAEELFAVAPVRALDGSLTAQAADVLAKCPHLRRIRTLDISGGDGLTANHLRRLLTSPHIAGLRELKVSWLGDGLPKAVAEIVAESEPLAGLESLNFWQYQFPLGAAVAIAGSKTLRPRRLTGWGSECGDAGALALANSPAVSRLEYLNLCGCQITAAGAKALAESPHLGPLWHLDLGGNPIGVEGVASLASSPRLANLKALELGGTHPGAKGAEVLALLARSELVRGLRRLAWRYNHLRAKQAALFADAPAFAQLRALDLGGNGIGDPGADAVARSPHLARLERLDLDNCSIKEAGAKAIAESESLRGLTRLDLGRNRVADAGAEAIAKAHNFPALRELHLNNNCITDAGAIALANSPQLDTVEVLYLNSNRIGDTGAKALLDSPHLKRVRRFDLSYNKASRALKREVEKRFAPTEG